MNKERSDFSLEEEKYQSGTHFAPLKSRNFVRSYGEVKETRAMSKKDSSGLTMMELIIVLAVLGILLAAASPLVAQFSSGYRLRAAAREIATDLQFARLLAVKENTNFQVRFISSDSYQVERESPNFVVKSRSFSIDYPEVALTGSTVTFNSRGNLVSGPGSLTVSNPMGTKNISVGSTGRVKLG